MPHLACDKWFYSGEYFVLCACQQNNYVAIFRGIENHLCSNCVIFRIKLWICLVEHAEQKEKSASFLLSQSNV